MIWAILTSFWLSFAASTAPIKALPPFRLENIQKNGRVISFDINFGFLTLRQARAFSDESFPSVRLPASYFKSGRRESEMDFLSPELKQAVWKAAQTESVRLKFKAAPPSLRLASLEPVKGRGSRLARAEIWIGGALVLKVSLMKSKWSADPEQGWVAYPAQWRKQEKDYLELVEFHDKELKKKITFLIREEYARRYGEAGD